MYVYYKQNVRNRYYKNNIYIVYVHMCCYGKKLVNRIFGKRKFQRNIDEFSVNNIKKQEKI